MSFIYKKNRRAADRYSQILKNRAEHELKNERVKCLSAGSRREERQLLCIQKWCLFLSCLLLRG